MTLTDTKGRNFETKVPHCMASTMVRLWTKFQVRVNCSQDAEHEGMHTTYPVPANINGTSSIINFR